MQNIVIKTAEKSDSKELTELFTQAFGYEAFAKIFIKTRDTHNIFILKADGLILSVIFVLNESLISDKTIFSCAYLYAITTKKEYRGNGLFKKLFEFTKAELKHRAFDFLFLVPASTALFSLYKSLGFNISVKKRLFTTNMLNKLDYSLSSDLDLIYSMYCKNAANVFKMCKKDFELFIQSEDISVYTVINSNNRVSGYIISDNELLNIYEIYCPFTDFADIIEKKDCGLAMRLSDNALLYKEELFCNIYFD